MYAWIRTGVDFVSEGGKSGSPVGNGEAGDILSRSWLLCADGLMCLFGERGVETGVRRRSL